MKRLCLGLVLLGLAGAASAQELGSFTDSPACCQLTTSLLQDVVYGKDTPPEEQLFSDTTPPNLHFIIDTSGSMRELPQVVNSRHSDFFNLTVNGCENPRLDAFQLSRGWNPSTVYPAPDVGTGLGGDYGFPNLFQDNKFYGYMYWADSSNPAPQWSTRESACQSQVVDWSGAGAAEYVRCLTCLSTKGYYKVPGALGSDSGQLANLNFMFWGRFLNFNPPKYVTAKAVLKSIIKDLKSVRVGLSVFNNASPYSTLIKGQNSSCSHVLADSSSFEVHRASYINSINSLVFNTGTPLARTLLNVGYYFTSDDSIYRNVFGFGTGYSYPASYKNPFLSAPSRSVCWGCQGSSVILITDGEPATDSLSSTVVTKLRTVNGGPVYCPDSQPCGSGTTSGRDKGSNPGSYTDDNPNYYLDDVARLLYAQDLQSSFPHIVGDFDTSGKQSLRVHTIGFGINSNLLRNTAVVGGGLYSTADDAPSLKQALLDILSIPAAPGRTAGISASVDSQPMGSHASTLLPRIKLPTNPSKPWQGALYRFLLAEETKLGCNPLTPSQGDLNGDGDCDDTHLLDANGDVVIESASGAFVKLFWPLTPAQPFWEAGEVLKPSGSSQTQQWMGRRIFTIVDTNMDGKIDHQDTPVAFTESNAPLLRDYLGISQNPGGCADLAAKLGEPSLTPDECARLVIRWYRGADALNPDPVLRFSDRPFLLQDIFHSTPISVEPPQPKASCAASAQCLPSLFLGSTELADYSVPSPPGYVDAYEKYAFEAGDRDKVVLVGSNGGMLHAFLNGRSTGSVEPSTGRTVYDHGTGQELWAFIPPDLLPRLRNHLDKHAYFVDGTAMVRDVWLDGTEGQPADGKKQWQEYRTVAVVGTGRGGVHRFALDLTRVLGLQPGDTAVRVPDQARDFLWMWPQPCDPLALKVGESFSQFAPQPPPIGPVALSPGADDALRALSGTGGGGVATPWWIDAAPARERWVVALNGGYDPYNTRGRGMALVDLASGHTVWSFFHQDSRGRSQHLSYSLAAGLALADVGNAQSSQDADQLFDTATVGDSGGQLWTVRFWQPGQWDAATQQVSNWHAARAFRAANLAGMTASPEALRAPFTQIATNVVQPDTGALRTFLGTGDSQNLMDTGTRCRLGNLRACAEQGCGSQAILEIQRAGATASYMGTAYADFALSSVSSFQGPSGPSCAGARVALSWDNTAANGCGNGNDGSIEYVCDGSPSTWSCRETQNTWTALNDTAGPSPNTQRFYGVWSYGGPPSRRFNTHAEAELFDSQLFTDVDLVNVGQFSSTGAVLEPQVDAPPQGRGWYIPYTFSTERTGSAATLINGCLLWNSFEPSSGSTSVCSTVGQNTSRLYQADPVSGRASCAAGFYEPVSGAWSRFRASSTRVNLRDPAPQQWVYDTETHTRAILSTPPGSSTSGTPFTSVPVSEGPP